MQMVCAEEANIVIKKRNPQYEKIMLITIIVHTYYKDLNESIRFPFYAL